MKIFCVRHWWGRGVMKGARGAEFPGRRITVWGAEKAQQCHKYFLQCSTFASERPQVRTWGRQTCLLSRGHHLTLLRPWHGAQNRGSRNYHTQKDFNFAKQFLRPPWNWRPWYVPCLPYRRYATACKNGWSFYKNWCQQWHSVQIYDANLSDRFSFSAGEKLRKGSVVQWVCLY